MSKWHLSEKEKARKTSLWKHDASVIGRCVTRDSGLALLISSDSRKGTSLSGSSLPQTQGHPRGKPSAVMPYLCVFPGASQLVIVKQDVV